MRKTIMAVDDFYSDPEAVREYARSLRYYHPYQPDAWVRRGLRSSSWMTSWFQSAGECPFKSSVKIISTLEQLTGESIDERHWGLTFPIDQEGKADSARINEPHSCLWNCSFHVKLHNRQAPGEGVHNHVTDAWNSVGRNGWAGLIYLDPCAPLAGGLALWRNRNMHHQFDWMTPKENWDRVDDFGNVFNRLLLIRGDIPHSGAAGWGDGLDNGRMFQTFFFKVRQPLLSRGIEIPAITAATRRGHVK